MVEGRFIKDVRNDSWNNVADVGLQHRWRLLEPIGLDLTLGVHSGRYLGLAHERTPAEVARGDDEDFVPDPPGFLDFRVLLATYVIF